MKKKSQTEKSNFKNHPAIKSVKSLESYFGKKYNLPYLNLKERIKVEEIRKKKYPNYQSLHFQKKLDFIDDSELKTAIKEEIKDLNVKYERGGKDIYRTKVEILKELEYIIDIIILKQIQKEENEKDIEEETRLNNIKEKLFKRQQNNRQINYNKNENYNQELEDMCIYGNIIKKELEEEKKKNPQKFIEIKDALNLEPQDKETFALGLFAHNLQEEGIEVAIEKEESKDEEDLDVATTCLQFMTNSMHNKKKYELHFDFGNKKNTEYLNNEEKFNELKEKIKIKISKDYKIPKDKIIITYPQKGSLSVQLIFQSDEFNNLNLEEFKQKFKKDKEFSELQNLKEIHTDVIIGACKLKKSQLDSRGNRVDGWGVNEKRGNVDYKPPVNWIGIGLKVLDKYDNGNNDWIGMSNKKGEWCVAYHGVGRNIHNSDKIKKVTSLIYKTEFKPGDWQIHEDHDDIYHPGNRVGRGVYCSPDIDVAESFSGTCIINGKSYKTVLMARVKQSAIRSCEDQKDYWVVNGTKDEIRPYRILYKLEKGD